MDEEKKSDLLENRFARFLVEEVTGENHADDHVESVVHKQVDIARAQSKENKWRPINVKNKVVSPIQALLKNKGAKPYSLMRLEERVEMGTPLVLRKGAWPMGLFGGHYEKGSSSGSKRIRSLVHG